jgi:hypothetical protein
VRLAAVPATIRGDGFGGQDVQAAPGAPHHVAASAGRRAGRAPPLQQKAGDEDDGSDG